jgi:ribosomal protein S18 acetylase RimI-like enzyme
MSHPETLWLSAGKASDSIAEESIAFRRFVREDDRTAVVRMCLETGFFHEGEIAVAEELVLERLNKGPSSGYEFIFAERDGIVLGYACFGPIPCTQSSWDLYWIVVSPRFQRMGIGGRLLGEAERVIRDLGGTRIYIETSGRQQYRPTREFYEKHGYTVAAALEDFYAPGDPKIIYVKVL